MRKLLTDTFGWKPGPDNLRVLTDDGLGHGMPTKRNILESLRWLAAGVKPGDVLFFLFSGHGAQKEDPNGFEEDGMNETVLPIDFQKQGMITDDQMAEIIVHPLPEGVRLTCLMDSCHSGTGLDLPWTWVPGRGWREDVNPFHCVADVQMFSGCEDAQCSSDGGSLYGQRAGAMTTAFGDVMRKLTSRNMALTYDELLQELHKAMRNGRFAQRPQLTSSQPFGLDRLFIMDSIVMNSNVQLGRIFRRRFPPQPRPYREGDPLGSMLGLGAGVVMGAMFADMLFGL